MRLNVRRMPEQFFSDQRRVITRLFLPGGEERIRSILERVLALPEDEVSVLLERVRAGFGERHKDINAVFREHFAAVKHHLNGRNDLSPERRQLIGAYFTMEYSIEAAALFNPSIVPHPDQSGTPEGSIRFIMSLRATGEGHVSSIAFRTGIIRANGELELDPISRYVERAKPLDERMYHKHTLFLKLIEMGAYNKITETILERMPDEFTYTGLSSVIEVVGKSLNDRDLFQHTAENVRWLAHSNYHLQFPPEADVSEVVIFPVTENESRGIEDARFVRFVDDDGTPHYYGTYTAYNGFRILPQLLETPDFRYFRIATLNGRFAQNKGMALFPRKIDGWYTMISRVDNENLYIMSSKNIRFWNDADRLQAPRYPWEFIQIGNCGSPLETEQGWLLLTHGVGPMRTYCIGAMLLDLENPSKVIGHLKEPLLVPNEHEREGYVPNVVYSCGAIIHNDQLIMPYAMSDSATSVATVSLPELLDHLKK
ncbi:MAG: glycosidase [Planctomycetes bacterium]|nr:glycosidase [Planctomycetota bacterium]